MKSGIDRFISSFGTRTPFPQLSIRWNSLLCSVNRTEHVWSTRIPWARGYHTEACRDWDHLGKEPVHSPHLPLTQGIVPGCNIACTVSGISFLSSSEWIQFYCITHYLCVQSLHKAKVIGSGRSMRSDYYSYIHFSPEYFDCLKAFQAYIKANN